MRVLVLNSGSSSVKYQLIDSDTGGRIARGAAEEVADHGVALRQVIAELPDGPIDAVGHRVVHGGEAYTEPTAVDDEVLAVLRSLVPLAPLHNPANIAGIEVAQELWPDVPQVAVFDTAFHGSMPDRAFRYAVPAEWYLEHGVRRYGFHGTSHQFVAGQAANILGRPLGDLDLIVAHLGNGASITAIARGTSIDTSMGLTPLEGLVMGTRSGDVEPTVVTHVADAMGRSFHEVAAELNTASGLLGLCGASDMRVVTGRAAAGDPDAVLALDVFSYRIKKYVGAYIAALGGCDAVVFTAGIGEHNPDVRAAVCNGLEVLGISVDPVRNERGDQIVSTDGSAITVLVVPTDEERLIAEQTAQVVTPHSDLSAQNRR